MYYMYFLSGISQIARPATPSGMEKLGLINKKQECDGLSTSLSLKHAHVCTKSWHFLLRSVSDSCDRRRLPAMRRYFRPSLDWPALANDLGSTTDDLYTLFRHALLYVPLWLYSHNNSSAFYPLPISFSLSLSLDRSRLLSSFFFSIGDRPRHPLCGHPH